MGIKNGPYALCEKFAPFIKVMTTEVVYAAAAPETKSSPSELKFVDNRGSAGIADFEDGMARLYRCADASSTPAELFRKFIGPAIADLRLVPDMVKFVMSLDIKDMTPWQKEQEQERRDEAAKAAGKRRKESGVSKRTRDGEAIEEKEPAPLDGKSASDFKIEDDVLMESMTRCELHPEAHRECRLFTHSDQSECRLFTRFESCERHSIAQFAKNRPFRPVLYDYFVRKAALEMSEGFSEKRELWINYSGTGTHVINGKRGLSFDTSLTTTTGEADATVWRFALRDKDKYVCRIRSYDSDHLLLGLLHAPSFRFDVILFGSGDRTVNLSACRRSASDEEVYRTIVFFFTVGNDYLSKMETRDRKDLGPIRPKGMFAKKIYGIASAVDCKAVLTNEAAFRRYMQDIWSGKGCPSRENLKLIFADHFGWNYTYLQTLEQ